MAWRIVIAGGGFGGFYAARDARAVLPPQARTSRSSTTSTSCSTRRCCRARRRARSSRATSSCRCARSCAAPTCASGSVAGADPARNALARRRARRATPRTSHYDQLIVALGSVSRTLPIPGLAEHAIGFKTLPEAIALRNHVAAHAGDRRDGRGPARARASTSPSSSSAPATRASRASPSCRTSPPTSSTSTRAAACRACAGCSSRPRTGSCARSRRPRRVRHARAAGRGIEIRTRHARSRRSAPRPCASPAARRCPTRTLVWTAGVRAPSGRRPARAAARRRGRIVVDATMQVDGHRRRLGDRRCRRRARPGPEAQGALAADRAARDPPGQARGAERRRRASATAARGPFTYKTLGVFVDIGRFQAVASTLGIRWRGFPAWFLARTYHLLVMPGSGASCAWSSTGPSTCCSRATPPSSAQLGHPPALEAGRRSSPQSAGGTQRRRTGRTGVYRSVATK